MRPRSSPSSAELASIKKRVRSGELHPLTALDLLHRQRLAGGNPSEKVERWCEERWQRKRRRQG